MKILKFSFKSLENSEIIIKKILKYALFTSTTVIISKYLLSDNELDLKYFKTIFKNLLFKNQEKEKVKIDLTDPNSSNKIFNDIRQEIKDSLKVNVEIDSKRSDPFTIKLPGLKFLLSIGFSKIRNMFLNKNSKSSSPEDSLIEDILNNVGENNDEETISLKEILKEYLSEEKD